MRGTGLALGAVTTHIDDALGCGEWGIMGSAKVYFVLRFGALGIQETEFTHAGMARSQSPDLSLEITPKVFTDELELLPPSTELWQQRRCLLASEEVLSCPDICWPATVSRLDGFGGKGISFSGIRCLPYYRPFSYGETMAITGGP